MSSEAGGLPSSLGFFGFFHGWKSLLYTRPWTFGRNGLSLRKVFPITIWLFPHYVAHSIIPLDSTQLILITIYIRMLAQNVFNTEKGAIQGSVFHLFYMDLNTSVLYDRDLTKPIIWGSKTIVIGTLKKIDEEMKVKPDTKVRVYSYILGTEGFRRIQTYNGPISGIGKYLIRY